MNMFFIWIFLLISNVIEFNEGKVIISIQLKQYNNPNNLMHDGSKCENFHWAGDHCDPMFKVCISTYYDNCNILYKFINFWKNEKYISYVMNEEIEFETFPNTIKVNVIADDHDRYDAHDRIAVFSTSFQISRLKQTYRDTIVVYPGGQSHVQLTAQVMVACATNYYGKYCNTYCNSNYQYYCDSINGEKICKTNYYGKYCEKFCKPSTYSYMCNSNGELVCKPNFYGMFCHKFCIPKANQYKCDVETGQKICTVYCGTYGACIKQENFLDQYKCKCDNGWIGETCQIKIPQFSISKKATKLRLSTILSTKSSAKLRISKSTINSSSSTMSILDKKSQKSNDKRQFKYVMFSKIQNLSGKIPLLIQKSNSSSTNLKLLSSKMFSKIQNLSSKIPLPIQKSKSSSTNLKLLNSKMFSKIQKLSGKIPLPIQKSNTSSTNLKLLGSNNEKHNSKSGNFNISELTYSFIFVALMCFILIHGYTHCAKIKYKRRLLEVSLIKRPLPVIYNRNPKSLQSNIYSLNDSDYDSCVLPTGSNDDFHHSPNNTIELTIDPVYEEPVSTKSQRFFWEF